MSFDKTYSICTIVIIIVFLIIARLTKMKKITVFFITFVIGLQYICFRIIYPLLVFKSTNFEWFALPVFIIIAVVDYIQIKKYSTDDK